MKGCIYSVSKGLKSTSSQSQTKQTQMQPQKPSLQSPNGPKGRAELVKAQTPSIVSRAKQCPQKHVQWFQWLNLTSLWGQGLPAGSDPLCLHLVLSTFLLCSSHAGLLCCPSNPPGTLLPQGLCTSSALTTHSLFPFTSLLEGPCTKLSLSLFFILCFVFGKITYTLPTC